MEDNSVTRAISNVQKQSEIHNGKFKESFSELFADVLKSCRETGCLETQKENLLAVLEEASLVDTYGSAYEEYTANVQNKFFPLDVKSIFKVN